MRKIILFLFISCLPFFAFGQDYQQLSEKAFELIEQDSLPEAEQLLLQALKLEPANPHNALIFSNLGTIQRQMKKYEEALESYTFALYRAPASIPILMNRATLNMELGNTDRAYIDYCEVLDIDKQNAEALLMRGYIYVTRRDYNAARIDYNRLLEIDPLSYSGRLGLVTLNQKEGKYPEALKIIADLLVENPDDATLYTMRAGIEIDMQQPELAIVDLEESIRLKQNMPEPYLMLGEIYLLQNKKALAKQNFEKAISLGIPQSELREQLLKCK